MISPPQAAGMNPMQRVSAMGQIQAALKRDRKNTDALLSAASIHQANREWPQAIGYLLKVLPQHRNDANLHVWLAKLNAEARDFKQAKLYSLKAVELQPTHAAGWQLRGQILENSGDPEGAIDAFERALELTPNDAELVFQIGNCHTYIGDHDKALQCYRKTLEMRPTHPLAIYGISNIHRFQPEEVPEYLRQVDAAIAGASNAPPYQTAALHFGAGKALQDAGEFDRAFERYLAANAIGKPAEPLPIERAFESNRRVFTKAFVEPRAKWGDSQARPIFIVGMPRSGTTLVESLVAAHSAVSPGGEMPMMDDIAGKLGMLHTPTTDFLNKMMTLTRADITKMAIGYLSGAHQIAGAGRRFTDKLPHNFMNVGLIFLFFPNAKIIHCRRHPVDTCVSIFTNGMTPAHNHYKTDLAVLGRYYRHYLELMDYWDELFPGRIHHVHYEDVVSNTELCARAMVTHLGLDWEDGVLSRQNSQKSVKTLSAWQVRQPVYSSSMGKWRRFEKKVDPLLDALGDSIGHYEEELKSLEKSG